MPNGLQDTTATQRVKRSEDIFAGELHGEHLTFNETEARIAFLHDGGSQWMTDEHALHQAGIQKGRVISQEEARARGELIVRHKKLSSLHLFRRRYTRATATVSKDSMSRLSADVSEQALVNAQARTEKLAPLSRRQRKHEKAILEAPEKEKYETAQANVTSQFVTKDVISSAWAKENVLDQEVTIHTEEGKEQTMTQEALLKEVLQSGDCSNLEVLDPVLRNLAASKYLEGITLSGLGSSAEDMVNALFKQGGVSQLMHPLFRIGISVMAKGGTLRSGVFAGKSKEFFAEIEDLCNQRIMSATMYTEPKYQDGRGADARLRNRASQIFMAKNLLLAHLGKMQQIDTAKDGTQTEKAWSHGMATAFAHCSRVAISMPTPTLGDDYMLSSLMKTGEGQHGFKTRMAATHTLERKRKTAGGRLKEIKAWPTCFTGQYGMNVAVGGLDNDGVPGMKGKKRTIKNDGSGGHIYMHVSKGDDETYTGLLVGFESDAPGVYNQTGHKHGAGNPEFMSSFGGLRTDEIGDKYGGRVVDCTAFSGDALQKVLSDFESKMNELMRVAHANEIDTDTQRDAMAELMNICDMLSGKQMSDDQLRFVLGDGAFEDLMKSRTAPQ